MKSITYFKPRYSLSVDYIFAHLVLKNRSIFPI